MLNRVDAAQPAHPPRPLSSSNDSRAGAALHQSAQGPMTFATGVGASIQRGRDASAQDLDRPMGASGVAGLGRLSPDAINAIQSGNLTALTAALADVKDINAVDARNDTLLSIAAESGSIEIVKLLRQRGARIQSAVQEQVAGRGLRSAALAGDAGRVSAWIAAGVQVDAPNKNGASALLIAAQNGQVEVVKQLVEAGANVGLCNQQGNTASVLAALKGHLSVVNVLSIIHPLREDQLKAHAPQLKFAIENNEQDVAVALIAAGVDLTMVYSLAIFTNQVGGYLAGSHGSSRAVIDAVGETLKSRATGDWTAFAQARLNHSMVIAAALGKPELTKALHLAGARIPESTLFHAERAFRDVTREKNPAGVKAWLEAGVNVNSVNQDQVAALMYAVQHPCEGVLDMLIEAGADLNLADKDGETATIYAAKSGNLQATDVLCSLGANLEVTDLQGMRAFQWAIFAGHFSIADRLLQGGAQLSGSDIANAAFGITREIPSNQVSENERIFLAAARVNTLGLLFLTQALLSGLRQSASIHQSQFM